MQQPTAQAKGPYKPPYQKKAWSTPVKDADMERLLERLDRIARDVESVADAICEKLGIDPATEDVSEDGGDTEELEDSPDE